MNANDELIGLGPGGLDSWETLYERGLLGVSLESQTTGPHMKLRIL